MANIKSQKKRILTNAKANAKNTAERSRLKTSIKKVILACKEKDVEKAKLALNECNSYLDGAQAGNLKHKNYVSRQKSRLAKLVNSI